MYNIIYYTYQGVIKSNISNICTIFCVINRCTGMLNGVYGRVQESLITLTAQGEGSKFEKYHFTLILNKPVKIHILF